VDEVTVVDCQVEARQGVPFVLALTDRRIIYSRLVSFRMTPTKTRSVAIADAHDVRLGRRSPWPLIIGGTLVLAAAITGLVVGQVFRPILMVCAGVALIASALGRLVLSWREGKRRHRVPLLISTRRAARVAMRDAMVEVAGYLADPARLAVEVARLRELAAVEPAPALDDRRLCPDGACVGVIGADERCAVCGAVSPLPLR